MSRSETLCFDKPEFTNRDGILGTAPEGVLYVEGRDKPIGTKQQKAALRMQVFSLNPLYVDPTETSIGVSVPSRFRAQYEHALRHNVILRPLRHAIGDVAVDVLAEESWWTADYVAASLPNMKVTPPTEQYIFGNDDGHVRFFNFGAPIEEWHRDVVMRQLSRLYAFLGTNLFNVLTDIVVSKAKGDTANNDAMYFRDQLTMWINPLLLTKEPQLSLENDLGATVLEGALAHELGHAATPQEVIEEYAESSGLSGKFIHESRKAALYKHRGYDTVNIFGYGDSVEEEIADVYALLVLRPDLLRSYCNKDTGYLVDALAIAFEEIGYPLASELRRTPLYWQRRTNDQIRYPVLSVSPRQDFHVVLQFQDKFIKGMDYQKDE